MRSRLTFLPIKRTIYPAELGEARIANLSPTAQNMLKVTWPEGCPKLVECDNPQLDKLVAAIQVVEAEHNTRSLTLTQQRRSL